MSSKRIEIFKKAPHSQKKSHAEIATMAMPAPVTIQLVSESFKSLVLASSF
jgi:hypothetical protein